MIGRSAFIRILSFILCLGIIAFLCACGEEKPISESTEGESHVPAESVPQVTESPETAPMTDEETSIDTVRETDAETAAVETATRCRHQNTEIRNQRDATLSAAGYTGDLYCRDCGEKISDGRATPQLSGKTYIYTLPDGTSLALDASVDPRAYTMHRYSQTVSHQLAEIEYEILWLCNIEREKEGLAPLSWYEDAYCFTKIRADEIMTLFEHLRHDGRSWDSVYTEKNVLLIGVWGENLYRSIGYPPEGYAERAVKAWMNSEGHRANIMDPNFTYLAVAVTAEGNTISAAQHFFGQRA